MTLQGLIIVGGVLGVAAFFASLGYVLGCKVTTRRHLPALLYAAKNPTPMDLSHTVARRPRRPDGE